MIRRFLRATLGLYLPPRIRDAAGVSRTLFNPFSPGGTDDPDVRALSATIVRHDRETFANAFADPPMMLPGCLMPILVAVIFTSGMLQSLGVWTFPIVFIPVMILLFPLMNGRMRRRSAEATRDTLLGHGRCPSCAYATAEVPPAADGFIHCPECEAAWDPASFGRLDPLPTPTNSPVDAPPQGAATPTPIPTPTGLRAILSAAAVVRDRRGVVRPLARIRRTSPPELRAVAAEIARATRRDRWVPVLGWAAIIAACLLLSAPMVIFAARSARPTLMPFVPVLIPLIFAALRIRRSLAGTSPRCTATAADMLASRGICPSCLGPLTPTPTPNPTPQPTQPPPPPPGAEPPPRAADCPRCHAQWATTPRAAAPA